MAAGLVTKTVGDGNGGTFTAQFWSSDGTTGGTLSPAPLGLTGIGLDQLHTDLIAATPAGSNIIGKVTTDQTTHGTTDLVAADMTKVAGATIQTGHGTAAGTQRVELPSDGTGVVGLNAGANTIGAIVPVPRATANGTTSSRVLAAATTNATSLKASAGNIARIDLFNVAAYDVFVKFYNKASAPTVGTDTPVWTAPLKAGTGYSSDFLFGKSFATGIAYAITKLVADADTTAVAAGDVTGAIDWV